MTNRPDQPFIPGGQPPSDAPASGLPHPGATPPAISFTPPVGPPPVFTAPAIPRRRRGSMLTTALLGAAAIIAVAGVAFAAGRITAPAAASTGNGSAFTNRFGNGNSNGNGNGNGGFGAGRAAFGGIGIQGTITAVNGDTLTLQLANGQTVQVKTDASTAYHKQAPASASDVTNGSKVIVNVVPGSGGLFNRGETGSTPSVTASDITVTGQ